MKKILLIIFVLGLIIGIIVFKSNNIDYSKSIVKIKTITNDGIIEGHGFVYKIEKYAYNKFNCLIKCLEEASITCQKDMC